MGGAYFLRQALYHHNTDMPEKCHILRMCVAEKDFPDGTLSSHGLVSYIGLQRELDEILSSCYKPTMVFIAEEPPTVPRHWVFRGSPSDGGCV